MRLSASKTILAESPAEALLGLFWRDYYGDLAGLPMKLRDPGTLIDPDVAATDFIGRQIQSIRVTYDAELGGDTWYFYFDPESAQLVGRRFYHDEAANDGEYIASRSCSAKPSSSSAPYLSRNVAGNNRSKKR